MKIQKRCLDGREESLKKRQRALEEERKTAVKEEKTRRKREEKRICVGKEEYCNNLRNMTRRKLGDNSKEWRRLCGCWFEVVDRVYAEYLGSWENQYEAHESTWG